MYYFALLLSYLCNKGIGPYIRLLFVELISRAKRLFDYTQMKRLIRTA